MFNWTALKPNQINGTVFNEIDDERVLEVNQEDKTSFMLRCRSWLICVKFEFMVN